MKLGDIMQRNVEVIAGDATVRDSARRMKASGIGALPVCTNGKIVGMLTDRDLVVRSLAEGHDPDKTCASDIMTRDVAWCYEDQTLEQASQKMGECQIQRLLVMSRENRLVGIVSLADLTRARGTEPAVANAVEAIKAPTKASAVGFDGSALGR